jgi:hypothetical protein
MEARIQRLDGLVVVKPGGRCDPDGIDAGGEKGLEVVEWLDPMFFGKPSGVLRVTAKD